MSMNIKSEEAHRLAREIAELTHTSVTAAVTEALREKRARLAEVRARRVEAMLAFADRIAPCKGDATSSMDDFYDPETGLPM